jgi:hypothetical protein
MHKVRARLHGIFTDVVRLAAAARVPAATRGNSVTAWW